MKKMDVDAKQMIRDYIDSIDEYMKEKTNLHPNEIDGLLNEINDFIYLRSKEISTNKKIHFKDILKAIDECGSPSEICEQYTDLNAEDKREKFAPKSNISENTLKKNKSVVDSKSPLNLPNRMKSRFGKIFSSIFSFIKPLIGFKIFRIAAILFYSFWIIYFLSYFNQFIRDNWDLWLNEGTLGNLNFSEARNLSIGVNLFAIICLLFFIATEGIIIDHWKTHKFRTQDYNREKDDSLILFFSRFGSLLFFLKCSIMLNYYYLLYIPLWILLILFLERRFKSDFWKVRISPIIVSIGLKIEGRSTLSYQENTKSSSKESGEMNPPIIDTLFSSIMLICLSITFLWPYFRIRHLRHYLNIDNLPHDAFGFPFAFSIPIICVLFYSISRRIASKYNKSSIPLQRESTHLIWFVRLLVIKTIVIVLTYTVPSEYRFPIFNYMITHYIGLYILIILWIVFEIVIGAYGGEFIRRNVAKGVLFLGGSDFHKAVEQIQRNEPSIVAEIISTSSIDKMKIKSTQLEDSDIEGKHRSDLGYALNAFLIAGLMFIVILYQVVIASGILTSASLSREYHSDYIFEVVLANTIVLIAIQLLISTTIGFYNLAKDKAEGIFHKAIRTASRVFLLVFIPISLNIDMNNRADTIVVTNWFLLVMGLLVFNEIAAWSIRSEKRKRNQISNDKGGLESQKEDKKSFGKGMLNKISEYL